MKDKILNVSLPAKRELREYVIKLKENGIKIAPVLSLILGRWLEQFQSQDDAMHAGMQLYSEWQSKHSVMDQIEAESTPVTEYVEPTREEI